MRMLKVRHENSYHCLRVLKFITLFLIIECGLSILQQVVSM